MSLWELGCVFEGWAEANGHEKPPEALSNDEHDALVAKYAHI